MKINAFLEKLRETPSAISFADTMATIEANYNYTPTHFKNGDVVNDAGSNEGSCKIFAFAKLHSLEPAQTLQCFGDYYRQDVLEHPTATDHGNIRNFMTTGWDGIVFDGQALTAKA